MSDGSEKICVLCGESCAGQPRIKDPRGRYYHKHCHEQAMREKRRRHRRQEKSAAEAFASSDPPPPAGGDDEFMSMLLDEAPPVVTGGSTCPSCGQPFAPGAVLCVSCGYNVQSGQAVQTAVATGSPGDGATGNTKWPVVIGVISIILAVVNLGCGGVSALDAVTTGNIGTMISVVITTGFAVWLLISGIGVLRRSQTGFTSLRIWAAVKTILTATCLLFVFGALIVGQSAVQESVPEELAGMAYLVYLALAIIAVWLLFWPVFCLIWTGRSRIREEVSQWS